MKVKGKSARRRLVRMMRRIAFMAGAVALFVRDEIMDDVRDVFSHGKLFLGIALSITGLLSYASDRYCDGSTLTHYTCTRPSTYYYYPWWAIALVVVGTFFIVLWYLRRKSS